MTGAAAVELRGAWYCYPGGRCAVRGASLTARPGEAVAVMGPNGAGKTTLLKLAAALLRPARGSLVLWGRSYWELGEEERLRLRRRLVYVHEHPVMFRGTVLDNVALGLLLRGLPRGEALERARMAAERLGLGPLLGKRARSLSRGQQVLVALARALALEPAALLLDEPLAHLDFSRRRLLYRVLLEEKRRGAAIIFATHDGSAAERLADRVAVVEEGRITVEGPAGEVLERLLGGGQPS